MKKKLIIAIIAAIVVLGGGIVGYVYHSNQVKAEKLADYKKALQSFYEGERDMTYGIDFILTDYLANWSGAIHNQKALDKTNKVVDCESFNDALSMRYTFYTRFGAFNTIDSAYISLGKYLETIKNNAKEENSDVVKLCEKQYEELSNAITMAKDPNGSYMDFSMQKGNCFQKLYSTDRILASKGNVIKKDLGSLNMAVHGELFLVDRNVKTKEGYKEYSKREGMLQNISWRLQNVDYDD